MATNTIVTDMAAVIDLVDELQPIIGVRSNPVVLTALFALLFTIQFPNIGPDKLQEGVDKTSQFVAHLIDDFQTPSRIIIPASLIN